MKPTLPRGTRDYSPEMMLRRNYIIDTIKSVFKKFGFMPLETPAMENLSVLMGKYGEEGDQLLYKILNSGDFLSKTRAEDAANGSKTFALKISEKGLRYDLTVPFARYVVMNQNTISYPFKRYQIQPVWRGDAPQRGRYREFYQCDADVVGTSSLICEAEIILMMNEVLQNLQLNKPNAYQIKINNRKILAGIAEVGGVLGKETDLCVAIDKLDKIGEEKVIQELLERGFSATAIEKIKPIFAFNTTTNNNLEKIDFLKNFLKTSNTGLQGILEIEKVFEYVESFTEKSATENNVMLDITLARGLSYYTGAIFEVKVQNTAIGSISGGGRYDDLTGSFGLKDVAGVGFSFGLDRIYDVLEEFELFPAQDGASTQILIANFEADAEKYALKTLKRLRDAGINAEIYPQTLKLEKQLKYANAKKIPFMLMIGLDEVQSNILTFKDMNARTQEKLSIEDIIKKFALV